MSMKRFLSIGRKSDTNDNKDTDDDHKKNNNNSNAGNPDSKKTYSDSNSIDEISPPLFIDPSESNLNISNPFQFNNDPNLNLNPSISNSRTSASVYTKDSDFMGKSIFSQSKHTFSTKQSSYASSSNQSSKRKQSNSQPSSSLRDMDYGQPLQILDIAEDINEDTDPKEVILDKLHQIYQDISLILNQFNHSSINLTTAAINTIEVLKTFINYANTSNLTKDWDFSTYNNADLRKIMKIYLNYYDNLLSDEVYIKLRLLLVKNFNDFSSKLNDNYQAISLNSQSMIKPQNFAIGTNGGESLPNEDTLTSIIHKISTTTISVNEQNGSFIAPIVRGISSELNILCLYFGYPNPSDYHYKLTKSFHELFDDVHILVMKNQIDLASTAMSSNSNYSPHKTRLKHAQQPSPSTSTPVQNFKLPFRNPTNINEPPMSLSLSIETSARTSGTMGGFIYPKIDLKKQPNLVSYANSKFAISCGHVCLDKRDDNVEYPHVSAPLSVLVNLYKQALNTQYQKFANQDIDRGINSDMPMMEAKTAYGSALKQLDENFPMKKIKIFDSRTKQEKWEIRNFPKFRFGQIIWGERTLIQAKKSKDGEDLQEKRLSDLAIIKVNKNLKCDSNYLGNDITFNEFDPSLMFDNLYVRKIIKLNRKAKELKLESLNDVDSSVSSFNSDSNNGIPVFKYGSTTKFTSGHLNGIRLVYWLDGAIHSSEFVVNSIEKNSAFAAGGDSGSWILSKLEDVNSVSDSKGLGVLGMLHSYDGEFKQFGLFTPMCEILDRLEEVTNIKWGVVGVNEKHDDESILSHDSSDSETNSHNDLNVSDSDSDFDSVYESGDDDANPPGVD